MNILELQLIPAPESIGFRTLLNTSFVCQPLDSDFAADADHGIQIVVMLSYKRRS